MNNKPKGYFEKLLILDCETSGLINGDNSAINSKTGEYCQAVSMGLIVVNSTTLAKIDELYVEIQWDGKSQWHDRAQQVHGLTKQYLKEHGVPRYEAVELIGNFILYNFGPDTAITVAAHNPHFDVAFLRELMESEGIVLKFSHRKVDTNSIGFAVFNTYTSDQLFELIGITRDPKNHNALDDARGVLKVLQTVKTLSTKLIG